VIAVCLAPVLAPPGTGRTAIIDPVHVVALTVFTVVWLAGRRPVRVPFFGPVLLITVGSVLATFNATNPGAALLTLIQDAYLYACFVLLANLLRERGDFRGLRLAWVLTACGVAIYGIVQVVTHGHASLLDVIKPRGFRAVGTFDQPDELADYLVMSIFMALSLNEEVGRAVRWSAIALMGIGIVATKANGGITALMGGLVAWALVRAWTKRASLAGLVAGALLAASVGLAAVWLIWGAGIGSAQIRQLEANSILGRMSHSSEGRMQIWAGLWRRYASHPLGIGPGNSRWQVLTIEELERTTAPPTETFYSGADPFLSKEAHNDYVSFLIERGPLALLFMLVLRFQVFGQITRWWKRRAGGRTGWVRGGPLAAAAFGAWVASSINANTIETLHFRHVWLFLAMVCALGMTVGEQPQAQPDEPASGIGARMGASLGAAT